MFQLIARAIDTTNKKGKKRSSEAATLPHQAVSHVEHASPHLHRGSSSSSWSVWWSNLIVPGSLVAACTRSRYKPTRHIGYPARWSPTSHCSRRNIRTPDHHLRLNTYNESHTVTAKKKDNHRTE